MYIRYKEDSPKNMNSAALIIKQKSFILFFFIAGGVLLLNYAPLSASSPILILMIGIVFGALFISIFAPEDSIFLFNLFLIGFAIRAVLSYLFYTLSFMLKSNFSPGFLFPNDGFAYSQQGWQIARFIEKGIMVTKETFIGNPNMMVEEGCSGNITQYDFFVSYVYSLIGKSPLSLFFITSLASCIAALLIYLIAKELFSRGVARISALFAFLWPSFIMWSTQNLKEPILAMLIFAIIWAILCMYRHVSPAFVLLLSVSFWALFKIGIFYAVILACAIAFSGLFLFVRYLLKDKFLSILTLIVVSFSVFLIFKSTILSSVFKGTSYNINDYGSVLEFLNYHRSVRVYGNLQFLKDTDISSVGKVTSFMPIGLLYALFSPFPWQLGSFMQAMAVPETILFYIMLPFTLKGIKFAFKKRPNQSVLLLSFISALIMFLALIEGNSGTLFRHRSTAFYLLFIFTSAGLSLKKKKNGVFVGA